MSAVGRIQRRFTSAIVQPTPVAQQPEGRSFAEEHITGNARLSPEEQLDIYREQFWLRHVEALREDFVTLAHLLGDEGFEHLVERYVAAHPPRDFSLRDLGKELPGFMARADPYRDDELLVDCARFEWAFVEAFDAADAKGLDPAATLAVPEDAWADMTILFQPSVHVIAVGYPVHELRARVRAGESPARPEPKDWHMVVYRGPKTLLYVDVEPLSYELLVRLMRGESLGAACEAVAAGLDEEVGARLESDVGRWFQSWTAYGWLSGLRGPSSTP